MRIISIFLLVALLATVFSAPNPKSEKTQSLDTLAPNNGQFRVETDGVEETDHSRSRRWGGWGWGRPWGMGWRRPWGMGWRRPWGMGMGGWGGYGGYGWGR